MFKRAKNQPPNPIRYGPPKVGVTGALGRAFDSVLGIFAPGAALKRRAHREIGRLLDSGRGDRSYKSSYRGSETTRLRQEWLPGGGSADEDLLPELPQLRERSRDLIRNDPHASGVIVTMVSNTIGKGIRPQSRVRPDSFEATISEGHAADIRGELEGAFENWNKQADVTDKLDFYGLQRLAFRQILENGDSFAHFVRPKALQPWRELNLMLEIIEADRVTTPTNLMSQKNIREGIELDDAGRPVTYHILKGHPGDYSYFNNSVTDFTSIPARDMSDKRQSRNILHLYEQIRAGQSRGVPFLSPALAMFKDLADYLEAELVAARIAACYSLFITQEDPATAAIRDFSRLNSAGQREYDLEPGMIQRLSPGETIQAFSPERAGGNFSPYVERMLRSIGAAIGFPLELIGKDFSKTNYSSARASLLEARKMFITWQSWFAFAFCQPVWEKFVEAAYLEEKLPSIKTINFYDNFKALTAVQWITPGWGWVDPQKEVKAHMLALNAGITSRTRIAAMQGEDIDETLEQLAREAEKIKELEERVGAPILSVAFSEPEEEEPEETDEEE